MLVLAITLSLKVKGKHAKGLKDAKGTSTYETIETASVHENFAYTGVGHQFVVLNIAISNAPAEVAAISISEGKVMDVHVVQQKAYVAAGGAGFRVMDISEPMSPKEIGFVNTPGYAEGVTVLGYNAYVADGGAGLRVIDISEPAEPREVGFVYILGYAFDVEVFGNYAYVAGGGGGLRIVDVSDPIHPFEVGDYDTPGYAYGLTVVGNTAYVADGWEGLCLVNVSNPKNPRKDGCYDTPGWAFDVAVVGNRAYVADAFAGVRLIDVSNQSNPVEIGAYEENVDVHNVSVIGHQVYAADRKGGLRIIQVSTLENPTQHGFYEQENVPETEMSQRTNTEQIIESSVNYLKAEPHDEQLERRLKRQIPHQEVDESEVQIEIRPVGQIGGPTQAVAVKGDYAYVGIGLRMEVLDMSDSTNPQQVGSTKMLEGFVTDITINDSHAYVTAIGAGLWVIDISDPTQPNELGFLNTPGFAEGVAVDDNYAYIAAGGAGLRVVDFSNPANPKEIGYVYMQGYAFDVKVVGNFAYIAGAGSGLRIVDVSDPKNPIEVGGYDTPGYAHGISVVGNMAYVADEWAGMRIINVSNPTQLVEVGFYHTPGQAFDVAVDGNIAYVADAFKGLRVIDVTSPSLPIELGAYDELKGHAEKVCVTGNKAYVADKDNGLIIINTSNKFSPVQESIYLQLRYAEGVVVVGEYAYVAAGFNGLSIIDIADPEHPRQIGNYPTEGYAIRVSVVGNYAYLITRGSPSSGMHIIDVSNPNKPTRVSYFDAKNRPFWDLVVLEEIAYIANEWGLFLLNISDPHNPFDAGFIHLSAIPDDWICAIGVDVNGTLAYVAVNEWGVKIVDVSNPQNLTVVGTYSSESFYAQDVTVIGDRAYVAGDRTGLRVLDVSNSANPFEMGFIDEILDSEKEFTVVTHVAVGNDIAYIATGKSGVSVVNVSDPHNPMLMAEHNTSGNSSFIFLKDNLVYVGDENSGLLILEMVPLGIETIDIYNQSSFSTWVVTTTTDAGQGSLRWCIENSQNGDSITFNPSIFSPDNPATITLVSELPAITQGNVTIDASNAGVILDGSKLAENSNGIIISSNENIIRGLQVLYFPGTGVFVLGNGNIVGGNRGIGKGPTGQGNVISGNNRGGISVRDEKNIVVGNLIGTDASGTQILGIQMVGVGVNGDNRIGGIEPWERNIICGHMTSGVCLDLGSSLIGNFIGTDITGSYSLGNNQGVGIEYGAYNNLVKGNLISGNNGVGITIWDPGSSYNTVIGNIIGLDASGTQTLNNGLGISIGGKTYFNRIGGISPEERNIISGNNEGIGLTGFNNIVIGNYIGTDINGATSIGNGTGITVGFEHNFIGGMTEGERNVISANSYGIQMAGDYNFIAGNYIGLDASATKAISNIQSGISFKYGSNNYIGPENFIANNGEAGISIHSNNATGNTITRNSITNNTWSGISLSDSGNNELAPPVITSVTTTSVSGTAPPNCTIEVFSDPQDEGKVYEGTTSSDNQGSFAFSIAKGLAGPNVTATATDINGNTSEFSYEVKGVNESPFLKRNFEDITLNEDFGSVLIENNLYNIFDDTGSELKLTFIARSKDSLIEPVIRNDTLWINSVSNANGNDKIIVTASDLPGLSISDTFKVIVLPVNDPPYFIGLPDTISINEDSTVTIHLWEYVEDPEIHDSLLYYEFSPGTDSLLYQFDHNTGEIRFSVDFGYGGISIFVIQVSDDKGVEIRDSLLILVDTNTGIDDLSFINSIRYLLCQNYPNPFSTNTTISFIISETSFVSLKVYNILGEEVAILLNKELIAGEHNVVFNAGNLSEGIYLYKLFTGDFIDTKRMLLLR